jgi:hypothetical protein
MITARPRAVLALLGPRVAGSGRSPLPGVYSDRGHVVYYDEADLAAQAVRVGRRNADRDLGLKVVTW